jgi:hypothetical protein
MMMLFKNKLGLVIRRHRTRSSIVTQILESSALLSPYLLASPCEICSRSIALVDRIQIDLALLVRGDDSG